MVITLGTMSGNTSINFTARCMLWICSPFAATQPRACTWEASAPLSALAAVMEGKTVLAIAHRLSTISQMDRIIVMDEGRIVEEGNHRELLASGGLNARYWDRQSGGFIGISEAAE